MPSALAPANPTLPPRFSLDALRAREFSWATALSLCEASNLAYESARTVREVVCEDWGFADCRVIDIGDTQAFFADADGVALLAFRGSESFGDWLGNIDLSRSEWPGRGAAHRGFLKAFASVRDQVEAFGVRQREGTNIWLTGHSLGGAIAVLAAAELTGIRGVAGVHTFGQPRLVDDSAADWLKHNMGDRLVRFVNNNDLVTRVPPNFLHAGRLIHFDGVGDIRSPDDATEAAAVEGEAVSEAEFAQIQQEVEVAKAAVDAVSGPIESHARAQTLDATIEGIIPSLKDHRLDRYIAAIRRQLGETIVDSLEPFAQFRRFSLDVEGMESIGRSIPFESDRLPLIPVMIRLRRPDSVMPQDLIVNSRIGTIVSAQATTEQIDALQTDPRVASIDVSRDGGRMELAEAKEFVGHTDVGANPGFTEKGDRALVGIIDTGVDVLHRAFRDAAGRTRILALWHQAGTGGRSPQSVDPSGFTQTYGRLYTEAEINEFINGGSVPNLALRDPKLHGTHVASIAAGRGIDGKLADGLAPEAKLVIVIPHMTTEPGSPPSLGYSSSHADAVDFLARVSSGMTAMLGKPTPMAINVSLGMNAGAHDGSSLLEAAFDEITGGGRSPGLVIVKSAGNERSHHGHVRMQLGPAESLIEWKSLEVSRPQDYFEFWYDHLDLVEFRLVAPNRQKSKVVSVSNKRERVVLGNCDCELELTPAHPDNGQSRLRLAISPMPGGLVAQGLWGLKVRAVRIRSRTALIDGWVERDDRRGVEFLNSDDTMCLSIPGTARTVITVAACHKDAPLRLTKSSSFGLTRDGRAKPDLCAPGANITAAAAGTPEGIRADTGTSMAAPMVTGTLALALSYLDKNGPHQLNANQLQSHLISTVNHFSQPPHPGTGFGLLNVAAFLQSIGAPTAPVGARVSSNTEFTRLSVGLSTAPGVAASGNNATSG